MAHAIAGPCSFSCLERRPPRPCQLAQRSASAVGVAVTFRPAAGRGRPVTRGYRPVAALAEWIVDPWSPLANAEDAANLASTFFALSLFPYIGFLYHLTRSEKCPRMTLFGFYFLLVFVFATIPAGIYAKTVYHTSLANVDYLHGGAESLLTVTNLLLVLGLRGAIRDAAKAKAAATTEQPDSALSAPAEPVDQKR